MIAARLPLFLLTSLGLACGGGASSDGPGDGSDDASSTDPSVGDATLDPGDSSTSPGESTDPGDTTAVGESSSDDGTDEGSTTASAGSCGDATVDDGEQCDDGNDIDGDGCNVDCVESGAVRWELLHDAPAGGSDCAYDVAINATGQVAIAGDAEAADFDSYDVLAASIAADGSIAWDMIYDSETTDESGGGSTDRAYGVAIEDDGEVIVAGHEMLDVEHAWVRKLDASGDELWTRTGADTDSGRGYGVALGADGEVYVVGTHGLYAFVTRYNSKVLEYWTQERKGTDGCNGCDHFFRARVNADGGVTVGGEFDNEDSDAVVLRMDVDGNDLWSDVSTTLGEYGDYVTGIGAAGEATLAVVVPSGDAPTEVRRYGDAGELEWTLADAVQDFSVQDVEGTADGGFVVLAGGYDPDSGYVARVRRFDVDGAPLWDRDLTPPSDGYQEVRAIAVSSGTGDIAISGCESEADAASDAWVAVLAP